VTFTPQLENIVSQYNAVLDKFELETQADSDAAAEIYDVSSIPAVLIGFNAKNYDSNPNGYILYPTAFFYQSPSTTQVRNALDEITRIIDQEGGDYDKITALYGISSGNGGGNDDNTNDGNNDDGNTPNGGGGLLGLFNGSFNLFGFDVPNWLALLVGAAAVKKATNRDKE